MSATTKVLKPRNKHAMNAMQRNGGAHEKSKSAIRSKDKRELRKQVKTRDFYD